MTPTSIMSKKSIRDHMIANSLQSHTFEVTLPLIVACNSAHHKYKESQAAAEKERLKEKTSDEKRVLLLEISKVHHKRDELLDTCKLLDQRFISAIQEAEIQNDIALKRRSKELLADVDKLNKTLDLLESKKQKLQ